MKKTEPFGVKTYVMTNPSGLVKIGQSRDPELRRGAIQRECGLPITLEFQTDGWNLERIAHKELAEYHVEGEWFSCSKDLAIETIKKNRDKIKSDLEVALSELEEAEQSKFDGNVDDIIRILTKSQIDRICHSMLLKVIKEAGTVSHLAKMLGLPVSTVHGWHNRGKVSKSGAVLIEENPYLNFTAKTLRPDL